MTALALPIRLPRKVESLPLPRRRWNPWGDFVRFASGKSNFLAKTIADLVYSSTAFTPNATIFFALWTATLSATSTGSTAGEASYTGYARVGVTNNATQFPAATGSSSAAKSNANAVVFGQNTGVSSQTVISGATCSASSAGQTLTIYDAPAVDATKIVAVVDLSGVGSWWYGCLMNGGLFYVISGGSPDVTIGYA